MAGHVPERERTIDGCIRNAWDAEGEYRSLWIAEAQITATRELTQKTAALVEQQRIANLIALTELRRNPNGGLEAPSQTVFDYPTDSLSGYAIKPEIKRALGIS